MIRSADIVESRPARVVDVPRARETRSRRQSLISGSLLLFVLAAACCAWILWLPVFPAQDGPVHVFYARVARDLFLGGHAYADSYRIVRPFPPYSVHAYLLMAFLSLMSGAMAEKLLACLAVASCAIGVAVLAKRVGNGLVLAAFAAPFLLNRFLFFGFYGYNLAIGLSLVLMASWMSPARSLWHHRLLFLVLMVLTMFSHPVPYLMALAFCWIEIACGWWNTRTASDVDGEIPRPASGDAVVLALASTLLLYIAHYAHSGGVLNFPPLRALHHNAYRVLYVFRTWDESPLILPVYNWLLAAGLIAATLVALLQAIRESKSGKITRTQLVVIFALLVLIGLPFLPGDMNGSGYFAERFSIWPPLLLIAAACGAKLNRTAIRIAGGAAIAIAIGALIILNAHLAPIARNLDVSSVPPNSLVGVHLIGYSEMWAGPEVNYYPYLWGHVRLTERSGASMVSPPWLNLQIMMLADIGTQARLTPSDGPEYRGGPRDPVGLVTIRCDLSGAGGTKTPSSATTVGGPVDMTARTLAAHPGDWRVQRFGCFNLLLPKTSSGARLPTALPATAALRLELPISTLSTKHSALLVENHVR